MLVQTKREQHSRGQKTLKFWTKIASYRQGSTYSRMDEGRDGSKKVKVSDVKQEAGYKGKASYKTLASKEVRDKESGKKGWKRFQKAALLSCRYMGLAAVHLNPATMYPSPEYSIDPKNWDKSFSSSYKPKNIQQTHHWTSNMMYSGW